LLGARLLALRPGGGELQRLAAAAFGEDRAEVEVRRVLRRWRRGDAGGDLRRDPTAELVGDGGGEVRVPGEVLACHQGRLVVGPGELERGGPTFGARRHLVR